MSPETPLLDVLHAPGPHPDLAPHLGLYGQFVGSWEGLVVVHAEGAYTEVSCEFHMGWVLEGRAVQDVWIAPARKDRSGPLPANNLYGTTLRVYDPAQDVWRITWINPFTQAQQSLIGRRRGADIVNEGTTQEGVLVQWVFTEIEPDAFHWIGRNSADGGKTWKLVSEFFFKRCR